MSFWILRYLFLKVKTAEQNNTPAINLKHVRHFHFILFESIHILNSTRCFTAPERAVSWLWLIFSFLVWPYCVVRFWHTGGCITHSSTPEHWLNFLTMCCGKYHFFVSELLFPPIESEVDSVHCLPQCWRAETGVESTQNSDNGIKCLVLDDVPSCNLPFLYWNHIKLNLIQI